MREPEVRKFKEMFGALPARSELNNSALFERLSEPKYPPPCFTPSHVEKQLPRLTGFSWKVYQEHERFQYRLVLQQDGTKLMSQCTIPSDESYICPELVRVKANALLDEFLAKQDAPKPSQSERIAKEMAREISQYRYLPTEPHQIEHLRERAKERVATGDDLVRKIKTAALARRVDAKLEENF